jgi:aspartyl/asparaginyl beta-hydroxylase (cupin superfamily)
MSERSQALRAEADRAAARGDVRNARALLEEAVSLGAPDVTLWMSLAACRRAMGDGEAALAAVDSALALEPRAFMPLLMRASLLERLAGPRAAGHAYGIAVGLAPPADSLPEAARRALEHARSLHAAHQADLAQALAEALASAGVGGATERRGASFIERLTGQRKVFRQEPVQFHYPGLPDIEFWERDEFPWLEALEASTDDIRAELAGVLAEEQGELTPYVQYPDGVPLDQWAELNHSPRWNAYHLLEGGQPVPQHAARCPKTMAAISVVTQPRVPGRSPAAMFSVLAPRTRIPPHTGIANTRLVLHLPLVVPPGCGFRVGAETRAWKVGEAWVFDDTIEHEAWNDSDQVRTILICDVWNPRLTEEDKAVIVAAITAMDAFNGADTLAGSGL